MSNVALAESIVGDADVALGDVLKRARNAKGYTLKRLSEVTGINQNSLAKYERAGYPNGAFPPLDKFTTLCVHLDLDPRDGMVEVVDDDVDTTGLFSDRNELEKLKNVPDLLSQIRSAISGAIVPSSGDAVERRRAVEDASAALMSLAELGQGKGHKTLTSRAFLRTMTAAENKVRNLDSAQLRSLVELATDFPVDRFVLLSKRQFATLDENEQDQECACMEDLLIVSAVYGDDFTELNTDQLQELAKAVNEAFGDGYFDDPTVAPTKLFELQRGNEKRLMRELPPKLLELLRNSKPIDLGSGKFASDASEPNSEDAFSRWLKS